MTAIKTELEDKLDKANEITRCIGIRFFGRHFTPKPRVAFLQHMQSTCTSLGTLLYNGKDVNNCLHDAERLCSGELKIYDLDPALFKGGIDWHRDYYTGHRWPMQPFNRIYDPNDSGIDLNVPFEISRMQFVPTLIQAYHIRKDQKYLNRMIELITDWIRKNPYGFGINWWSPMEVGLRAYNLCLAASCSWGHVDTGTSSRLLHCLWDHARYIYRYDICKNHTKHKNNHFLGAMLGLLSVSLCFRGPKPRKLRRLAIEGFIKEIPRQFYKDGGNFESATAYHQFSLEVVLSLILLLKSYAKFDDNFSLDCILRATGILERLVNAAQIVEDYMSCFGESPHLGDSSDCRVFVFRDYFHRTPTDHGFIGDLAHRALGVKPSLPRYKFASLYPKSGLAFVKNENYGIVAWAGPKGTDGTGGHGHNDKCSFVLRIGDSPVLVDCGTYIYNPDTDARYQLKKGAAHNILLVDENEQCHISPNRVFGLLGGIQASIDMESTEGVHSIDMEHNGYSKGFSALGDIKRRITCWASQIHFTEQIAGEGNHDIRLYLNLHPLVDITIEGNKADVCARNALCRIYFPEDFQLEIVEGGYSNRYHHIQPTKRLIGRFECNLPASLSWSIELI